MAGVFNRGGTWYVRWRSAAGWKQRATEARNRQDAKALAAELQLEEQIVRRAKVRNGAGLAPRQEDLTGTLAELCGWWLRERCPAGSRDLERQRLDKHVTSAPAAALPLGRLRTADVDELLHVMARKGAAPASVNRIRSVLHSIFARAKKAGRWIGENPVASAERRKVPRRMYATLRAEEVPAFLEQVPEDWRPLFVAALWTAMRKGELFALRKADVDLSLGLITVGRSHERDTTKGGHADLLPIALPLLPVLREQLERAPGPLVFPDASGKQRPREADPQKVLRTALARAGLVEGYDHRCRWCGYSERASDAEPRFCPTCRKLTDGCGRPLAQPRGRKLWPKAIPRPMRFHDLRHSTATLLLRAGVDSHRVQRILRHRDVRTTTGIYGHLDVEDLRGALATLPAWTAPAALPAPTEQHAQAAAGASGPVLAANPLQEGTAQGVNGQPAAAQVLEIPSDSVGGRSRIRTCDPCRVKAVLYR